MTDEMTAVHHDAMWQGYDANDTTEAVVAAFTAKFGEEPAWVIRCPRACVLAGPIPERNDSPFAGSGPER